MEFLAATIVNLLIFFVILLAARRFVLWYFNIYAMHTDILKLRTEVAHIQRMLDTHAGREIANELSVEEPVSATKGPWRWS